MVATKLLFLILSVIFIDPNLPAVNSAFGIKTIDAKESKTFGNVGNEKSTHVDYKRAKREDDTDQGKGHFVIENRIKEIKKINRQHEAVKHV